MQKNTLHIFGQLTDVLQTDQMEVRNQENTDDLMAWLLNQFPALQGFSVVLAVNNSIIHQQTPIASGDSLALMPPFSGG